jgi:transcriptional regulator GlxA family with amidase domain
MHVQLVLFDGFDPLDVVAPYEVLYEGGIVTNGAVTVELVSAEGPRLVPSGTLGIALMATAQLNPTRAGIILVPGASGRVTPQAEGKEQETIPFVLAQTLNTPLPSLIHQAFSQPEMTVATVCGGSLALAMAGLLEGRHVVTHHLGMDVLSATGAIPVAARIVDDGNLISAGGVTSGLDLGLYVLDRFFGPQVARAVEDLFEYERRGTPWLHSGMAASAV